MIGNSHAIAHGYIAAAALAVVGIAVLLALSAREVDRARRRELEDRRSAFRELDAAEHERERWKVAATALARELDRRAAAVPT